MNDNEITKKAVLTFGVIPQLDMAIEECAELIQAINKIKRKFSPVHLIGIKEGVLEFTNTKEALIYHQVCGEIADVKIMIKQLEYIFKTDQIDMCYNRKLGRLNDLIIKTEENAKGNNI